MNEKYIKILHPEVKDQKMKPCKECMIAKSTKSKVRKKAVANTKSKEVGECVASDLKEMFRPGTGGRKWMGSAIETKSRYALITCTKTKGQFADYYHSIVRWFTTQLGRPFKIWRTDGGGEFNNKTTDKVNDQAGIQHSVTAPSSSKKNPIAERFNRTAGEGIAAMLLTARMTAFWWVEAAQYFVYIYNRTPHKALGMKTPYEVFYGRQHHKVPLKVFGCLMLVHDEHRRKSSMEKATKAKFLGIDSSGRYKGIYLTTGNRLATDSAGFIETEFPSTTRSESSSTSAQVQTVQFEDSEENQAPPIKKQENFPEIADETPCGTPKSKETTEQLYDGQQSPREQGSEEQIRQRLEFPSVDNEEFISADNEITEQRYPSRIRQQSLEGLHSSANTPPPSWTAQNKVSHRDLEAIANAIIYDAPVPESYAIAVLSPEWPLWEVAIKKEVQALIDKETFAEANHIPVGRTALRCRWVFKIKPATAHEPMIYKARLVVQGYRQKKGVDFEETFAAVARTTSLRVMLALAAAHNTRITKLDVANAFLASKMDVEIYVHTPQGYPSSAPFLKLLKALYGLKQAPRLWYATLIKELENLGFKVVDTDSCVFKHKEHDCTLVIVVDDILVSTNNEQLRTQVETRLHDKFKIKAFGDVQSYIGLDITQTDTHIKLTQTQYIIRLLERFGMLNCKSAKTPARATQPQGTDTGEPAQPGTPYRQLVGALLYLFATRPDICAAVVKLSTKLDNPTEADWKAAKRVLRYLAGTQDKGIVYPRNIAELKLWARSDSDWAGCKKTRRSTSGYAVFLGGAVSWKSKMQPIVALSSCEAEYIALVECIKEILWLVQHLSCLGAVINRPIVVGIDNQAAMALAKNPVLHEKSKHIDTRHHFIRQAVSSGLIHLQYVNTKENVADILTKNTGHAIFSYLSPQIVS
jgi:hypothetical protein